MNVVMWPIFSDYNWTEKETQNFRQAVEKNKDNCKQTWRRIKRNSKTIVVICMGTRLMTARASTTHIAFVLCQKKKSPKYLFILWKTLQEEQMLQQLCCCLWLWLQCAHTASVWACVSVCWCAIVCVALAGVRCSPIPQCQYVFLFWRTSATGFLPDMQQIWRLLALAGSLCWWDPPARVDHPDSLFKINACETVWRQTMSNNTISYADDG